MDQRLKDKSDAFCMHCKEKIGVEPSIELIDDDTGKVFYMHILCILGYLLKLWFPNSPDA